MVSRVDLEGSFCRVPARKGFFKVPSMKWSIECLREGDRLQEHVARFERGGRYFDWITKGYINEYILVDFRTSEPPKLDCMYSPTILFGKFTKIYRPCAVPHICCI